MARIAYIWDTVPVSNHMLGSSQVSFGLEVVAQ